MERIVWLCYSGVFRISAVLGIYRTEIAGAVLAVGCVGGIPLLIVAYKGICRKYRAER